MREIKFRVWDKEQEEMFYQKNGLDSIYTESIYYELMQFTGLKDKNGKEIYEGDIVKDDKGRISEVVFWLGSFDFKAGNGFRLYDRVGGKCENLEIIGNIYENKELLK